MNKGLQAFKIMVKDNDLELTYHNTILTIEQELKDYEKLLKDIFPHPEENGEEYRQLAVKRLLALEIIKKLFDKYDFELISSYEDGKPIYILRLGTKQRKRIFLLVLTKEQFDLLKEVLL